MQWINDNHSTPPMFIELRIGKKIKASIKRIGGVYVNRRGTEKFQHHYQVVTKYVDSFHTLGPVFKSLPAAKKFVEDRLK